MKRALRFIFWAFAVNLLALCAYAEQQGKLGKLGTATYF